MIGYQYQYRSQVSDFRLYKNIGYWYQLRISYRHSPVSNTNKNNKPDQHITRTRRYAYNSLPVRVLMQFLLYLVFTSKQLKKM